MPQSIRAVLAYIVNYLTFPGVVIHELAHKIFCEEFGIPVRKVRYFRLGNPIGYVIHDRPGNIKQAFWISVGPLLVNTSSALLLSYASSYFPIEAYFKWILLWVSFSAGVHAFPSDTDIQNIAESRKGIGGMILYILLAPFLVLIRAANRLRPYGFDLVFALLLVISGGGFGVWAV